MTLMVYSHVTVPISHAWSCNYRLIACQLLQMYIFPFPIFLRDGPLMRLSLESKLRFGAGVTSYKSMWTVYRTY